MLKVGDKVRVIKRQLLDFEKVGKVVFIKDPEKSTCWPYLVEFAGGYCTFYEKDLEKIE